MSKEADSKDQDEKPSIFSGYRTIPSNPITFLMSFGPFAFGLIAAWFLWNNMVSPQLTAIAMERNKIYDSSMAAEKAAAAATNAAEAAKQAAEAARKTAEANQATAQVLQHITDQLTRVSEKIGYVQGRDGKDK